MRLQEFQISDAIQFHEELNPALWQGQHLDRAVRKKLLAIAEDLQEFIGVDNFDVVDLTMSGSNAAYTYTPHSDIDLHLVVMIPSEHDAELRELFDAKKYQYNDLHDFRIRGYDVEVYVQDAQQPHHSMGIYSVLNDRWISQPRPQAATIDDASVKNKYECYRHRIDHIVAQGNLAQSQKLWASIKNMRKTGLAHGGEFGPENVAFKLLRAQGDLAQLRQHIQELVNAKFSLGEPHA